MTFSTPQPNQVASATSVVNFFEFGFGPQALFRLLVLRESELKTVDKLILVEPDCKMAQSQSLVQQLDSQLENILSGWSIYSTILALVLVTYLLYPVFFSPEPDTHPLLLARQAVASPVRQPGESAIFRSPETPHGYPLRTGLNVKDPGAQKWMSGRDGDLRDVWKQALQGPLGSDNSAAAIPGKVLTVLGKEQVIEYNLPQLAKYINDVGKFLKCQPGSSVAIYLPNSVEYLVAFFGKTSSYLRARFSD